MDLFEPTLATPTSLLSSENAVDWRANVPTVSQLTRRLRGHLESTFLDVWVRGEISGFRKPASGHGYLVLKDAGAQLRTCLFRPVLSKLRFALEDGMEVLVHGRITIYEARGEYQMVGDAVEPVGAGALQLAFEQLKNRLALEGLFADAHKKPLPLLPRHIGVITSSTGAAIRDILKVLSRRFPNRHISVLHAAVQGAAAAGEIEAALDAVELWNRQEPAHAIEVLIVGRGGGSMEDLWPFNEERVARAIHRCPVPIISAVGHETDFTIADFVADVRAPTPSAAAELVLPRKEDLLFQVETLQQRLNAVFRGALDQWRLHLSHLSRRLVSPQQRLIHLRSDFERLQRQLQTTLQAHLRLERSRLTALTDKLDSLSPLRVLGRGYSLTTLDDGTVIRSTDDAVPGQRIHTRLTDGTLCSTVIQE